MQRVSHDRRKCFLDEILERLTSDTVLTVQYCIQWFAMYLVFGID
jgi:hypothetical protein